jgi:hypothetical protein
MARAALFVRLCAIAAMLHTGACAQDAVGFFEKYCPEHGLTEDLRKFCERWWGRYVHCLPGECPLHDPQRTGRPVRLTPDLIKRAAKEFGRGYYSNGRKKCFNTVEQVRWAWRAAHPPTPGPPATCKVHGTCPARTPANPTHHACRRYRKGPSCRAY